MVCSELKEAVALAVYTFLVSSIFLPVRKFSRPEEFFQGHPDAVERKKQKKETKIHPNDFARCETERIIITNSVNSTVYPEVHSGGYSLSNNNEQ